MNGNPIQFSVANRGKLSAVKNNIQLIYPKRLETQIFDISTNSDSNIILSYIREQHDSLVHTSKEKYFLKVKLYW